MYLKNWLFSTLLLLAVLVPACKSEEELSAPQASIFDQLHQATPLSIRLETDLHRLQEDPNSAIFQEGSLSWKDEQGQEQIFSVRLRPRGKSRRNFCEFPPIKLKFSKEELQAKGLATFNDLKLVTHCIDDEQMVLKEFLGYQLFRKLTDRSFRTQLVRIQYVDQANDQETMERYAFLIEDEQELAARMQAKILESPGDLKVIDAQQYQLLTVFQYMIGNTDWSLANRHNIIMLQPGEGRPPFMVPYDFDLSGMVNAPYALPHPMLPIKHVRQRFFQWRSKNREGLTETFNFFLQNQEELLQICQDFQLLTESNRKDIMAYLNSFFEIIKDPKRRQEMFLSQAE